jgi:hypothetical protein
MNFKKRVNGSWVDTPHYIHKTDTDTITTLPAIIHPTGSTATVGLKGNTVQNGTPSPSNPVDVNGVGVRTDNLFDYETMSGGKTNYYLDASGNEIENIGFWSITKYIPVDGTVFTLARTFTGSAPAICLYDSNKNFITGVSYQGEQVVTISSNTNAAYIRFSYFIGEPLEDIAHAMLNSGSTALPYEPYGYKIPILSANTTTPVYLGEVETVRKIKKLALTGEEEYTKNYLHDSTSYLYYAKRTIFSGSIDKTPVICNELPTRATAPIEVIGINTTNPFPSVYFNFGEKIMNAQPSGNTVAGLKEYLAAQYAAGTPVTVWYVLATPTTGIVNEPLMKIGNYADTVLGITIPTITGKDTIDVNTTLKPSSVSLGYTGWHDAYVKKYVCIRNIADWEKMSIAQMENYTIQELQGGNWV